MSIKSNFPSIRPSLNLDFASTKRLDPRISFSRSGSGATYVDTNGVIQTAAANVPRFDHDPATGESLGLLIEEQRTNLLTYSEQFDNAAWTKANATITANAAVAPDGTITADKIVENSTTATHDVSNTFSVAASTRYSFSVFIKAAERTWAQLVLGPSTYFGSVGVSAYFNLNSGTVGTVTSHATALPSATMKKLQNGWYLCTLTATTNATSGSAWAYIRTANADGGANYLGDGSGGICVWGAQLEAGAFPTSYIPCPATFTGRSLSATYYDSTGTIQTAGDGVARSNAYFPDSSGVMRPAGLLLEAASTNLVTYSEQFDNAAWTKSNVTVSANSAVAPDGNTTADTLTATSTNGTVRQSISTTAVLMTFSIFLKRKTGSGNIDITADGVTWSTQAINSSTWTRCVVTQTAVAGTSNPGVRIASNGDEVYAWGAQYE